jgi:adenylosuccinate lyase
MIRRYWKPGMRKIWDGNRTKFAYWLRVEHTVLTVREKLGQIPEGTADRVMKAAARLDDQVATAIERRDENIHHDLNAFLEIVRLQIILGEDKFLELISIENDDNFNAAVKEGLKGMAAHPDAELFHDGMTSYDTEEPATALLILDSVTIIKTDLVALIKVLEERARQHKGQLMVGRTHGQHAQPITFGVKILNWLEPLRRAKVAFEAAAEEAMVMKLSGAVGMYGTLGPEVEERVGQMLGLRPVIATQIVSLDRRARLVSELTLISDVMEKIAGDLWHMSQTEVGEIREPFGKDQKGSSAMPHKKNPIGLENVMGCAMAMRGYALAMLEVVSTSHERDIAHSSTERLAMVDAFGVVDHQLQRLTGVISGMTVFPERMLQNLEMTHGVIASQQVEMLLKRLGLPAEVAYRKVQELSTRAMTEGKHLRDLVMASPELHDLIVQQNGVDTLCACFDWKQWVKEEDYIYQRMGMLPA